MATRVYVLDGGGPKDSENTPNSFLTKCGRKGFWQIRPDMSYSRYEFKRLLKTCLEVFQIQNTEQTSNDFLDPNQVMPHFSPLHQKWALIKLSICFEFSLATSRFIWK